MRVEVITPEDFMGDVMGDLTSRRGQIEAMDQRRQRQVIRALVPLAEMFGYTTTLRSMTQGRAQNTMEPSHYDFVPREHSRGTDPEGQSLGQQREPATAGTDVSRILEEQSGQAEI